MNRVKPLAKNTEPLESTMISPGDPASAFGIIHSSWRFVCGSILATLLLTLLFYVNHTLLLESTVIASASKLFRRFHCVRELSSKSSCNTLLLAV